MRIKFCLVLMILSNVSYGQLADTIRPGAIFHPGKSYPTYLRYKAVIQKGDTVSDGGQMIRKFRDNKRPGESSVTFVGLDGKENGRSSYYNEYRLVPKGNVNSQGDRITTTVFLNDSVMIVVDSSGTRLGRTSFKLNFPAFDFETDYEVFASLPLEEGLKVAIPFYQPGTRAQPKYYVYEVAGTEVISDAQGKPTECWRMTSASYQSGFCTWWIAKEDQVVLKEERVRRNGDKSSKILMTRSAP